MKTKHKLRLFSPQTDYPDRAAAAVGEDIANPWEYSGISWSAQLILLFHLIIPSVE
jgi:hypothetical protein